VFPWHRAGSDLNRLMRYPASHAALGGQDLGVALAGNAEAVENRARRVRAVEGAKRRRKEEDSSLPRLPSLPRLRRDKTTRQEMAD
jgi:hypothetical protein